MKLIKKIAKFFNKGKVNKISIPNRIRLVSKHNNIGAKLVRDNSYCSITGDSILLFKEQKEDTLLFEVRTNFLPNHVCECHDRDIVKFNINRFKQLKYITL